MRSHGHLALHPTQTLTAYPLSARRCPRATSYLALALAQLPNSLSSPCPTTLSSFSLSPALPSLLAQRRMSMSSSCLCLAQTPKTKRRALSPFLSTRTRSRTTTVVEDAPSHEICLVSFSCPFPIHPVSQIWNSFLLSASSRSPSKRRTAPPKSQPRTLDSSLRLQIS